MKTEEKLRVSLLLLRLGVFTVMFMWTLDKFVNPDHAIGIYKQFYFLDGLSAGIMYALGGSSARRGAPSLRAELCDRRRLLADIPQTVNGSVAPGSAGTVASRSCRTHSSHRISV